MQAVEKTHHIEVEINGIGVDSIKKVLKDAFPEMVFSHYHESKDDEVSEVRESTWYRYMSEKTQPGDILKARRTNQEITVKELSEKTGIAVSNIYLMESNKRPIGRATAKKLAQALNCEASDFQLSF